MNRSATANVWLILILALTTNVASARWFALRAGRSRLSQIARSLAASPDGEVKQAIRLTRDPESPTPPGKEIRRKHNPILTAESVKCRIFAGPGEHTALIEVGLDAANMEAGDLLPTAAEILFGPQPGPAGTEAPTGQDTPAPTPADDAPGTGAKPLAPENSNPLLRRVITPIHP